MIAVFLWYIDFAVALSFLPAINHVPGCLPNDSHHICFAYLLLLDYLHSQRIYPKIVFFFQIGVEWFLLHQFVFYFFFHSCARFADCLISFCLGEAQIERETRHWGISFHAALSARRLGGSSALLGFKLWKISCESASWLKFPLFTGIRGRRGEEYNVCSDDTAFQCSSYQKLITIIQKSFRTFPSWLDTMITNQVLLLLTLSILWPSTALPFTPGNIGNLFRMREESDGRILQRSKRGWMWNQFFLLEEYTGNDHQYVGKVTCPNTLSAD